MKGAMNRIYGEINLRFQEVVLLASLFNQACEEGEISKDFVAPSSHLAVNAFALTLGSPFVPYEGDVIRLSRDQNCAYGSEALITFNATSKPVRIKTWEVSHGWLCLPEFDVWIDVVPPGSDPNWLTPVKYLPSRDRPMYERSSFSDDKKSRTLFSEVSAFSKVLRKLLKERGPDC